MADSGSLAVRVLHYISTAYQTSTNHLVDIDQGRREKSMYF